MRFLILCALVLLASAANAGGPGLHYGHGIQLGSVVVHYPTGDVQENGEWETIVLRRSTAYPRHYFDVTTLWHWSDSDPNPHQTSHNCNVFSPVEITAQEQ